MTAGVLYPGCFYSSLIDWKMDRQVLLVLLA